MASSRLAASLHCKAGLRCCRLADILPQRPGRGRIDRRGDIDCQRTVNQLIHLLHLLLITRARGTLCGVFRNLRRG